MTTVRAFLRGGYRTATGPVAVMAGLELVGTWTPAGHEPPAAPEARQATPAERQAARDAVLRRMAR